MELNGKMDLNGDGFTPAAGGFETKSPRTLDGSGIELLVTARLLHPCRINRTFGTDGDREERFALDPVVPERFRVLENRLGDLPGQYFGGGFTASRHESEDGDPRRPRP